MRSGTIIHPGRNCMNDVIQCNARGKYDNKTLCLDDGRSYERKVYKIIEKYFGMHKTVICNALWIPEYFYFILCFIIGNIDSRREQIRQKES